MAKNDWTGNDNSVFKTLGASNHTDEERQQDDYYATDPKAAELLLKLETFENILESACGEGHLSKVFADNGIKTTSSDLIYRGYGEQKDFFDYEQWDGDIVTNPPYKFSLQFVEHALSIVPNGRKVAMFLKLQFLEGKRRRLLFDYCPPKIVYVSSGRLLCAKNAQFEKMIRGGGSAVAYAWFVWVKGFEGDTVIKWFN